MPNCPLSLLAPPWQQGKFDAYVISHFKSSFGVSPTSLQLQNSKTVIQSKDTAIQELKEKIAYLEAEVCVLGSLGREWTVGEKTGHKGERDSGEGFGPV